MKIHRLYKILGCIAINFLLIVGVCAQSPYTDYEVLSGDTLFTEPVAGVLEIIVFHPHNGSLKLMDENGSKFSFRYIPDQNYVGFDTFTIEYHPDYNSNLKYLHGVVEVRKSFVHGGEDFYIVDMNSDYTYVDVLNNDSGTQDNLSITAFPFRENVYVQLNNGLDSLSVKPTPNFTGIASLIYQVCDDSSTCDKVGVNLLVIDTAAQANSDTLYLQTTSNRAINFYFSDSTYSLVDPPALGEVSSSYYGYMHTYTPFQNIEGSDTILYSESNIDKMIIINVLKDKDVNSYVVDDYIYVYPDDTIDFDVFKNDIVTNGILSNHSTPQSGTLVHNNDGKFTYIAPSTEGLYTFAYEACLAGACEVGRVQIYVGTLAPDGIYKYHLTTLKNRPFVINYDVPLSNFSFEVTQDPLNGTLTVYPGIDTLNIGCEAVVGYNLVTYTPDSSFVGTDLFELEYCASESNICQTVKIEMQVVDVTLDSSSCICVNNCVWPGDMNSDGIVDMLDLLTFGWHLGAVGVTRPFANENSWQAQYSPNWSETSVMGANMKHLDSDGNGIVEEADVNAIAHFFHRRNNLAPEHNPSTKEFPINLVYVGEPNPEIGDYVEFEIRVGNMQYPASFLHGISIHYDVDPKVVDTSTLEMSMSPNSFVSYDAMTEALVLRNGRSIDGAITRLDNVSPTGFGTIGTLGFVIEDDVDGIRAGNLLPIVVEMSNSYIIDGMGNIYSLKDSRTVLKVSTQNDSREQDIFIFPNPARQNQVIHARFNPVKSDALINIYSINGVKLYSETIPQGSSQCNINSVDLAEGIYIMTIREDDALASEKFIIQR